MSHPSPLAASGKSLLERAFLTLCKQEGFPEPVTELRFSEERKFRFDVAWPDRKVAVELDGGTWGKSRHTTGAGFERDCEKTNLAVSEGWRLFRFTTTMVEDGRAIEALHKSKFLWPMCDTCRGLIHPQEWKQHFRKWHMGGAS